MTLEEFDSLKEGDEVIITGMSNGSPTGPHWESLKGKKAKITGPREGGGPGHSSFWPADIIDYDGPTKKVGILWPDEIDWPKTTKPRNPCECGAHAVGIELYAMGHSTWCPGKQKCTS